MEQLATRTFAGVDLGRNAVSLSIYDEAKGKMEEERFPITPDQAEDHDYIKAGLERLRSYGREKGVEPEDFNDVVFCLEDGNDENRKRLSDLLGRKFTSVLGCHVISRFRAFAEYVFHQEKMIWDRNTLLLDYTGDMLSCVMINQIRQSKQKAYRGNTHAIDLSELGIVREAPDRDAVFAKMIRQFLAKYPANIIFLTGEGFEGSWMKKTLTYLCAGRRVFLGQNIYAGGACLLATGTVPLMDEGMILLDGEDMVCHTVGVVASESGKSKYIPVTSIGKEWYNTEGSIDIILDKSQRVEFFFHNTLENEMEGSACEIRDLPQRPPKTTRIRIRVTFTGRTEGNILLEDLGFGQMFPGTNKITIFPFSLVS